MEQHGPWKTRKSSKIYTSPWIEVRENEVITPGGSDGIYSLVHFRNFGIGILPLDEHLNTWIVGQYRYPLNAYTWELPEGGGPIDIPPLESAKRELLEETGIKANKWRLIQEFNPSNSCTDEKAYIYVARDLSFHDPNPDEDEELEVWKLPFDELYEMAQQGKIQDSITVMAVLKARLMMEEGKL